MRTKPIADVTPFSMLDFKGLPSAIVWFRGCNMRCSYCYNVDIINSNGAMSAKEVLEFLTQRRGLLKGVVLSGGEPTLYTRINHFASELKNLGFQVKLDTNGTHPKKLHKLLQNGVIDFVSLDYKAPKYKFKQITKMATNHFDKVEQSLAYLQNSGIDYEVRTTVHNDLLHSFDIGQIIKRLKKYEYNKTYFIQSFMESINVDNLEPSQDEYDLIDVVKIANEQKLAVDFRNF